MMTDETDWLVGWLAGWLRVLKELIGWMVMVSIAIMLICWL
jgi:hypothetical protein